MPYTLSKSFDHADRTTAKTILRNTARYNAEHPKARISTTNIIRQLADEGISYRRTNMLRDMRRAQAVHVTTHPPAQQRAAVWFDTVFETYQKEHGLSPREASKLWNKTVEDSYALLELPESEAEFWELYKKAF